MRPRFAHGASPPFTGSWAFVHSVGHSDMVPTWSRRVSGLRADDGSCRPASSSSRRRTGLTDSGFGCRAAATARRGWAPTVETLEEAVRLRYDATRIAATLPAVLVTFEQAVENERNRIARGCRAGTLRWFNAQLRVLLRFFVEAKPVAAINPADTRLSLPDAWTASGAHRDRRRRGQKRQ